MPHVAKTHTAVQPVPAEQSWNCTEREGHPSTASEARPSGMGYVASVGLPQEVRPALPLRVAESYVNWSLQVS